MRIPATEPRLNPSRNTGRAASMRVRGRSRAEATLECVPLRYQPKSNTGLEQQVLKEAAVLFNGLRPSTRRAHGAQQERCGSHAE
jgi:hypothetical protein